VIGGIKGGPQGAAIGGVFGGVLGRVLDPVDNTYGPKSDRVTTGSESGKPITRLDGIDRVSGNVIWLERIAKVDTPQKPKEEFYTLFGPFGIAYLFGRGSGLGPASLILDTTESGVQINTRYSANFAVGLAEGTIAGVRRIWANSKLVYDVTGVNEKHTTISTIGKITVYTGTETQLPDPTMERKEGIGNVSAHRGMAYVVFENVQLERYGNSLPNLQFEIATGQTALFPTDEVPHGGMDVTSGRWDSLMIRGLDNGSKRFSRMYAQGGFEAKVWNPNTQIVERQFTFSTDGFSDLGGGLRGQSDSLGISVSGLSVKGLFGNNSLDLGRATWVTDWDAEEYIDKIGLNTLTRGGDEISGKAYAVFNPSDENDFVMASHSSALGSGESGGELDRIQGNGDPYTKLWARASSVAGGNAGFDNPVFVGDSVFCIRNKNGGNSNVMQYWWELNNTKLGFYDWGDIHSNFTGSDKKTFLLYVPQIDNFVAFNGGEAVRFSVDMRLQGDQLESNILTITGPTIDLGVSDITHNSIVNSYDDDGVMWVQGTGNRWARLDVGKWISDKIFDLDLWAAVPFQGAYIRQLNAITGWNDTHFVTCYLDRVEKTSPTPPTLDTIVSRYCLDAGLVAGDIDVTDLASTNITGFTSQEQGPTYALLTQLAFAFDFFMSETGGKIVFKHHTGTILDSIPEQDLGANDTNALQEQIIEELELPELITITYRTEDTDYQSASQYAKRRSDLISTEKKLTVFFSGVLEHDQAAQNVHKQLKRAWIGRRKFDFKVPVSWLKIAAGDVYTVTLGSDVHTIQIQGVTLGTDWTLKIVAISDDPQVHISDVSGILPDFIQSVLDYKIPTELFLMDLPQMRPTDLAQGLYVAMAPSSEFGVWDGSALLKSLDGVAYETIGGTDQGIPWGVLSLPFGDHENWGLIDDTNILTCDWRFDKSVIADVTRLEAISWYNVYAIENRATGGWELISVSNTTIADNVVTFDQTMRGIFATEDHIDGHTVGDRIVYIEDTTKFFIAPISDADVGNNRFWKTVTFDMTEDNIVTQFTPQANMDRPWPVFNISGYASGGDIVFEWFRRSRIGFGLEFEELPLKESSLEFEIDVLDVPGGNVLNASPYASAVETFTYTAAQQSADGTDGNGTFHLNIYQIGDNLGRGIVKPATVNARP
jgi:hypothetical protein